LSKAIGVNAIEINSALVSAQNRKRLYWTNIGLEPGGLFGDLVSIIPQPKDKGILLKNILEREVDAKYYLSQQRIETMLKSKRSVPYVDEETKKFNCLLAGYNKIPTDGQYVVHNTMPRSGNPKQGGTGHLSRSDGKTYCLDTGNTNAVEIVLKKPNVQIEKTIDKNKFYENEVKGLDFYNQSKHDKMPTLANPSHGHLGVFSKNVIRRLTPIECERLQTVADNHTAHVSDTQRYKMLGNGWTIDVIAHIFSYLKF